MRSYPLTEARAEFSKLVDRALAGEPQRVTRRGREAVVIVSEAEWRGSRAEATREPWMPTEVYSSLGELIADFAQNVGFREEDFDRSWTETDPAITGYPQSET